MKRKLFFFFVLTGLTTTSFASDSAYTRWIVDTLCTPYFLGRGYVDDGMKKASVFIENEFKKLQIPALYKEGYFQPFFYPVNIFPGKISLSINGKTLVPGKDYIVGNESKSFMGKGKLSNIDSISWINPQQRIILKTANKLTWSVEQYQADYTSFSVLKSAIENPTQFEAEVESRLIKKFDVCNVAAIVQGTEKADSFLVFTAHYDHLGAMGNQTYFPGANDNASGIALLLSMAKYYTTHPHKYSILLLAFAGEEAGLVGSKYFVDHPPIDLKKIRFLTNLDLMGNGEEGITVVNATEYKKEFGMLQKVNEVGTYLLTINSRGKAANSDHYWFSEKGVPAFFIYTLGKRKCYHDVDDVAATLPLFKLDDLQKMLIAFYKKLVE